VANRIGKITTQGAITEFLLPLDGYGPSSIANGPGDTFWFPYTQINKTGNYIGRMIGASGSVTLYQLPTDINANARITRGPNNMLWFSSGLNQIGSLTADGALTLYTIDNISVTLSIAGGPDGAMWFTYVDNTAISLGCGVGRLTTDGSVTFYPVSDALLFDIKAGRDNDLWFAVSKNNDVVEDKNVGRITVDGTLTRYYMPQITGDVYPHAISHLGNGTFAFGTWHGRPDASSENEYIGTITPAGNVQVFAIPNADQVSAMAYAGWANEVWFTSFDKADSGKEKIYKFRVTN
jgi:virginiamycin B lyase